MAETEDDGGVMVVMSSIITKPSFAIGAGANENLGLLQGHLARE